MISIQECDSIWKYKATEVKDAVSGDFVSRTSKEIPFGITYSLPFPQEVKQHNVKLVLNANVRTSDSNSCGGFVFSVTKNDTALFYEFRSSKKGLVKKNEWFSTSDTLILPINIVGNPNYILTIYQYNNEGKAIIDADDIKLSFFKYSTESYLPEIPPVKNENVALKTLFKNTFYQVKYDDKTNTIHVADNNDKMLTQQIVYHLEYRKDKTQKTTNTLNITNFSIKKSTSNSIEFFAQEKDVAIDFILNFTNSPSIEFHTNTSYQKINVVREAIVFEMKDDVTEVYRNNRKSDLSDFQNEYWLDKEGVKFGKEKRATYFYHNTTISSAQLNTLKKQLIVNLDFSYDHLLLHFPLRQDTLKGIKEDNSETKREKGTSSNSHFTMSFGAEARSLPRFMKNPSGFVAAFIFTEHADYNDMRTQYAVNYGSEDIHNYKNAKGGFAKYNIPVTKSVFYNNPENINNSAFNKAFSTPICNLKGSSEFEKFIDDLYQHHFDICLHTPEQNTTTSKNLEEAIAYFSKKYNSKTWIDHGYDNGAKDNREDFVCDGLLSSSPQYALPLWQKYNTKYFWNCYYEDSLLFKNYHYSNHLKNYYHGFGDQIPAPDYWHQSTAPANIYSWPAHQLLFVKDLSLWQYYFNEITFNDLINNQEVCISHLYPSRIDENTGFFKLNEIGKYIITEEFDKTLALMSNYRDKNLLNLTTISNFLDYRTAVDKVKYEILEGNKIRLTNVSNENIHDLSMTTKSKNVIINGKNISTKKWNGELVFWFELEAGESVVIEYN